KTAYEIVRWLEFRRVLFRSLFEVGRPREELLGDVEPELAADQDVREAQPVEGDVDRAFRAVLDRHDPVVHPAPLHVVEDLADGRSEERRVGKERRWQWRSED